MATIRDLKITLDALSDDERFALIRELRQLRRMMRPEKEKKPRASPGKKAPKQLSLTELFENMSDEEAAKLAKRLAAQMKGAKDARG